MLRYNKSLQSDARKSSRAAELKLSKHMSFFDYYTPNPTIKCPVCDTELTDWTGDDGPCAFLTFRQKVSGAELPDFWDDPATDGGTVLDPTLKHSTHPQSFMIESGSCNCEFPIKVACKSISGVWETSEIFTGTDEDRRQYTELREVYRRRMKWLDGAC